MEHPSPSLSPSHSILSIPSPSLASYSLTVIAYFCISITIPLFIFPVMACCFSIFLTIPLLPCGNPLYATMSQFSLRPFLFLPPFGNSKPVAIAVASHTLWTQGRFCCWLETAGSMLLNLHPYPTLSVAVIQRVSHNTGQKLSDTHFTSKQHGTSKQNGLDYWAGMHKKSHCLVL